jgi:heme exporter protein D
VTPDAALLGRIYNRPEFIWARLREAAMDWLANVLFLTFDDGSFVPWLAFGLLVALIAALLVLLLRWRRIRRQRERQERPAAIARDAGAAELEAAAEALAAAGDWAGAIRHLFRAFVLQLDARGVVAHDPARTNRELRRRLQKQLSLEPALGRLIVTAETVTYAGAAGSDGLWQDANNAYRQLRQQLEQDTGRAQGAGPA